MAGTLSRVTTYVAATPILSSEANAELNQLVNLLAGTSSNIKLSVKVSDAGDPPLEVNQLSTGPIFKGFQAGVEKFRIRNDGSTRTPGIYDPNDNEELLFAATASAVNEFSMANAAAGNPPELRVTGGDANIPLKLVPKGTGVVKIQSGAPIAGEDAANKTYVDAKTSSWAATFTIPDIAARGSDANFDNIQAAFIPTGAFTATHIDAKFMSGSASGSFTIECRKVPFGSVTQTLLGSITFNPGTIGVSIETDIADHLFTSGDWVYFAVTTISSPLQKAVWCSVRGTRTPE